MASLNKVLLIGNVGRDPEARFSADGTAFCNITLACNESWKDKSGEKQEKPEWINVSFSGRMAEVVSEYVSKGDPLFVEGKFTTRKWQDKDGNDRYTSEVKAFGMQFLKGKGDGQSRNEAPRRDSKPEPRKERTTTMDDPDDDILF